MRLIHRSGKSSSTSCALRTAVAIAAVFALGACAPRATAPEAVANSPWERESPDTGVFTARPPFDGEAISASQDATRILEYSCSAPVRLNSQWYREQWASQLYRGDSYYRTGAAGSYQQLDRGELYLLTALKQGGNVGATTPPFPVVVMNKTIKAGSVGTRWIIFSDDQPADLGGVTYVVLLNRETVGSPPKNPGVYLLEDSQDCTIQFLLDAENYYVALPGHHIPLNAVAAPLSSNPPLETRVNAAKARADVAGLQPGGCN